MSIFDFFHRRSTRKQRQAEVEFNRHMAELNREAFGIKRQSEKLKAEAIRLENSGDHQGAMAAALAAKQQEKSYQSAQSTIQTCKTMHVQVKSQKAMEALLRHSSEMARRVRIDANAEKFFKIQSDFSQARDELKEASESLEAVQEGFNTDTEAQVRNEAGEKALAQIMEERTSAQAEAPAVLPVPEQTSTDDQHKAWADDRRKLLAEMM